MVFDAASDQSCDPRATRKNPSPDGASGQIRATLSRGIRTRAGEAGAG
jgi:hypothetical protein